MLEESIIVTWFADKIKLGFSMEAQMTKLNLLYFGHMIRRQDSLKKRIMLRKWRIVKKQEDPTLEGLT